MPVIRALGRFTLPADRAVVNEKVGFAALPSPLASLAEPCSKLQAHTAAHCTSGLFPTNILVSGKPHLDIKVDAAKNDPPLVERLSRPGPSWPTRHRTAPTHLDIHKAHSDHDLR